jgi:hypothetical protein
MPGAISKHGKKTLSTLSKNAKRLIEDPRFKARMAKVKFITINKNYDIPHLSGHAEDGKTVYIDRHLKTKFKGIDVSSFIRTYEVVEKSLLDLGLSYQEAYQVATHFERQAVESAKLNWSEYTSFLQTHSKHIRTEHLNKVPKNLDLRPYLTDKDKKILTSRKSSIKESVDITETKISLEYHDELNPKLWVGTTLKSDVREKLIAFAHAWAEFAMIPMSMIQDVIILGGNANFNYTSKSDIDVHLIIDRYKLPANKPMVDEYLQSKKILWTLTHNVSILGLPVEPYAQDSSAPYPKEQGVYSLMKDKWIQKPQKGSYDFKSDDNLKRKVLFYTRLIDSMIKSKMDVKAFTDLKSKIYNMRGTGIASGGEFSFENLVFKELRNRGYLDKIAKYEKTKKDQQLSLR